MFEEGKVVEGDDVGNDWIQIRCEQDVLNLRRKYYLFITRILWSHVGEIRVTAWISRLDFDWIEESPNMTRAGGAQY